MGRFALRRAVETLFVLLGASLLFFVLANLQPGDPIRALFGFRQPPQDVIDQLNARYWLDRPLWQQYLRMLWNLLRLDLGTSFRGIPVWDLVRQSLPVSLRLLAATLVVQTVFGAFLGLASTFYASRWYGRATFVVMAAAAMTPAMVVAWMNRSLFVQVMRWFPWGGSEGWETYVLPAASLGIVSAGSVALLTRDALRGLVSSLHVKAAEARGIRRSRIVGVHLMREALVPVATVAAAQLGPFVVALILVEGVYGMRGLGGLLFEAINRKDGPVVIGASLLITVVAIVLSTLADLLVARLDPRTRLE